ncbi:hypothetical protein BJY01DRAFT_246979 [Aspergillus pseudoustus]|uniref:Uncharacterized protein n=1 Tax=Aspergillus pseudoustus TaxID=1810923 RepID=A0ABR4K4F4_9EURO
MAPTSSNDANRQKNKAPSLRRLIEERNIHFYPIGEDTPLSLAREINVVQEIDNASYEENKRRSSNLTLKRKNEIVEAVNWCRKDENNEDDWRHEVEAKIVDAVTKYHGCPRCRKRLWRADIEFPIGKEQGKRWDDLRRRRRKRDKCACTGVVENARSRDRVFKSLRGRMVHYGPELEGRVPKGVRPDLVVGLYNGRKWKKILASPSRAQPDKRVEDVIRCDIFARHGDSSGDSHGSMIFPFLILEAKRARAQDSLEDIERQMALPAYEMLRTQSRLLESCTAPGVSKRLPRVWLVSVKAQNWKLYIATIGQDKDGEDAYNIYTVWRGDLSGRRDGLKFVLLLDCVFDWALDIYRLDIFEALESTVVVGPNFSRAALAPSDSDLSESLAKVKISSPLDTHFETLETIHEETQDVIEYKYGWVRDARQVLISAEGLLITAANLTDIFDSFEHPDHATRFARLVWEILSNATWSFPNEDILDRVRGVWTGEKYSRQQLLETPIYVHLGVYAYVNIRWRPVRKLIFVAATEDSIPELFKRTQYDKRRADEISRMRLRVAEDGFLAELRDRRKPKSAAQNLQDAMSRWHYELTLQSGELTWLPVLSPSCDKAFQEIFRMYQVGQKEPSESFLKIWHTPRLTTVIDDNQGQQEWLVVGRTVGRDWHHVDRRNMAPRLCVFVFEDLDGLSTGRIIDVLRYYRNHGLNGLGYDYTVMRGKYFAGSTRFDDNRSGSEYISPSGVVFPGDNYRAMRPSPQLLLDEWIQELKGESDGPESEEEKVSTDGLDHRGDGTDSESEEDSNDSDED